MKAPTRCQLCHRPMIVEIVPNEFFKTAVLIEMATCADCLADLDKPTQNRDKARSECDKARSELDKPPGWLPYAD